MVDLPGQMGQKVQSTATLHLLENQDVGSFCHCPEPEVLALEPCSVVALPAVQWFQRLDRTKDYGTLYHVRVTPAVTIKQRALEAGFDLSGVAPLGVWDDLEFSRRWVEQGYGGEMRYLENPKRHDPRRILPSVRSVVCVGLVYNADLPYSTKISQNSKQKAPGSRHSDCSRGPTQRGQSLPGERAQQTTSPLPGRKGQGVSGEQVSSVDFRVSNDGPRAWISRYAWGRDYHEVARGRLERLRAALEALAPGVETRVYADTGPIVERAFARLTGIGWMGKNTCLINQEKGSWFFLGVILTNLELAPDLPAPDRCGSCTRCIDACPTAALVKPYVMDASRCIAYFTIELKGSIPAEFRSALGTNVFGCDICQDVCPWNSPQSSVARGQLEKSSQPSAANYQQAVGAAVAAAGDRRAGGGLDANRRRRSVATTKAPEFQPLHVETVAADLAPNTQHRAASFTLFNPTLEALASLTENDFRKAFAHSPIKRAKYRGWLRNLCVAMGNSGDPRFAPWLERAREHSDPVVREHAEWALGRIHQLRGQSLAEHQRRHLGRLTSGAT